MKFRLTLGCALMGAAAFAIASGTDAEIKGSNVCGLMNVPSTAKETLIAVPWVTVGGSDATMKVANLVKTDTLTAGDELYFYDGSTYYRWVLTDGKWTPTSTTKKANDKKTDVTITAPGADYAIARGKGLWLVRQDTTKEIWLYGQHDASAVSVAVTAGTAAAPAYTLIANPNTADYDLNAKSVTGAVGDKIILDGGATLYTYKAAGWTRKVATQKTVGTKTMTVKKDSTEGCTIPAGQGAWYVSVGGNPTIAW